jgi:hypothetical protein
MAAGLGPDFGVIAGHSLEGTVVGFGLMPSEKVPKKFSIFYVCRNCD